MPNPLSAAAFLTTLDRLAPKDTPVALAYMTEMLLAKAAPFTAESLVDLFVEQRILPPSAKDFVVGLLKKGFHAKEAVTILAIASNYNTQEIDRIRAALPAFRENVHRAAGSQIYQRFAAALRPFMGPFMLPASSAEKPASKITFTPSGSPVVTSAAKEATLATSKPAEPNKTAQETKATDLDKVVESVVRVCQSKGPKGTATLSEIYERLPYGDTVLREAIHESTARGLTILHSTGLLESVAKMPTTITGWMKAAMNTSAAKGWYETPGFSDRVAQILGRLPAEDVTELMQYLPTGQREPKSLADVATFDANMNGEISELWEAFRAGNLDKPCDKADKMTALGLPGLTCAEEEMADIAIRLFDTAEFWGVDLEKAIRIKHLFNASRPHRHGGKLA